MSGAIDAAPVGWLVGAPVEKLLEQLVLQELEPRACFTHGREIGRKFLSAVAGKDLGKFAIMSYESWQRGKGGTPKVLEGIVCHASLSEQCFRWESGLVGFHYRDMDVNGVWQGVGGLRYCPSHLRFSAVGCGWLGEIS